MKTRFQAKPLCCALLTVAVLIACSSSGLADAAGGSGRSDPVEHRLTKRIQYPPVPRAKTSGVIGLYPTSAVMTGKVDARGGFAYFEFDFGRTARYGRVLDLSESDVVGSGYRVVAEAVNRLRQKTTYHYRIVAHNRSGVALGQDRTFTTPARTPGESG